MDSACVYHSGLWSTYWKSERAFACGRQDLSSHTIIDNRNYPVDKTGPFRWDERKVTNGQRTVEAIRGAEGKRLIYKETAP